MRDLFLLGFLFVLIAAAFARPYLMTMAYIYVDLVQPQRITYYLLNAAPISLIMAILAVLFFLLFDDKRNLRFGRIQMLMTVWLVWVTITTIFVAQLPEPAWVKWDSSWKAIGFGIFLPFVLRTRLRIEAALFFLVLCVGTITVVGGIKTLLGGGGYGALSLLVDNNTGLYEGSTIAMVSVALIPLILYLYKHNTLFERTLLFKLATAGLIFSALLMPIGTEARTGLICVAVLGMMLFLRAKRKLVIGVAAVAAIGLGWPMLPDSFTGRMSTIKTHDEDSSASTRVAVWNWTLDFVQDHPFGGGFGAYRLNKVEVVVKSREGGAQSMKVATRVIEEKARAYHSAYFEALGEHGYPGLLIYLGMLIVALTQLMGITRRFSKDQGDNLWIADLSRALSRTLIIFMVGATFIGVAFQTTLYILLALAASVAQIVAVRDSLAQREARLKLNVRATGAFAR